MKETVPVTVWVTSVSLTVKVSAYTDYACMDIYSSITSNDAYCMSMHVGAHHLRQCYFRSSHNYCKTCYNIAVRA